MPRLQIRAFQAGDVGAAGVLLAQRHRRHRAIEPLLSARYEQPDVAAAEVEAAFATQDASGAIALRGGEAVGFLIGAPKSSETWGPNVWVESAARRASRPR